ncbi:putative Co/Zn/Cd efflux system membrane fusion protein [Vulgatibacter incomptus]|uniref:Putative Co/Zn/Cd efflux system membrane fusion protein n=2 Tax=Vulgatibacter incomptus TaxID=1391653 RepID=A0A0K1P9C8_9BACT|nr:putative Co/Zn/Cd efflux system membrane fusion protein [Vulgatibacter incomptus]
MMSKGSKRLLPIAVAGALGIAAVTAAAGFERKPSATVGDAPGMKMQGEAITLAPDALQWKALKLGKVSRSASRLAEPVPARVRLDETTASHVSAPLEGRVSRVLVELGQRVTKGQALFAVKSQAIAELRVERDKAKVDLDVAKAAHERTAAMVEAKALPAKEELTARQELRQAELAHRMAGAKLSSLQVSSSGDNEFTVTAPIGGVVVEKNVAPSAMVAPEGGSSQIVIADLSSVWVVADLFASEPLALKPGTAAQIFLPSRPGVTLDATVEMVSAVVDPERHAIPVRMRLPNPDGLLRPNDFAEVRFLVEGDGLLEIPASALVSDGARTSVFVQEPSGVLRKREIVAGSSRKGRVPVLSGLQEGDVIVEEGGLLLDNQLSITGS